MHSSVYGETDTYTRTLSGVQSRGTSYFDLLITVENYLANHRRFFFFYLTALADFSTLKGPLLNHKSVKALLVL